MRRTPLHPQLEAARAQFFDYQGWQVPFSFGSVEQEYWAIRKAFALTDLSHRGRILVRGEDAPRFLNGMVSNDVKSLEPGHGNTAFVLNVHGHILADVRVLRLDEQCYLLDCEPLCTETVRAFLDRHIIADQVELEDQTDALACLSFGGPCGREVLREALGFDPPQMTFLDHILVDDLQARIIRASQCGEEGYWILLAPTQAGPLWDRALQAGAQLGGLSVGFAATEACRIEAGIPRYGADLDEKTLPQETGQFHAISFTKGCYVGQEVVERIRSRGHVNRRLMGIMMENEIKIPSGSFILIDGEKIGTVTSSAWSYRLKRTLCLGYVRREHALAGKIVKVQAEKTGDSEGTGFVVGTASVVGTERTEAAELAELPFPAVLRI